MKRVLKKQILEKYLYLDVVDLLNFEKVSNAC